MARKSTSVDLIIARAKASHRKGEVDEARAFYDEILARFPKNKRALDGLKALESATNTPATREVTEVSALLAAGHHQQALRAVKAHLSSHPSSPVLHRLAGAALLGMGDWPQAAENLQRAVAADPNYAEAYDSLGTALQKMGQSDGAIANFRRAITLRPGFAEAHLNLAASLYSSGQVDEAITSYRAAIALKPHFAEAYVNLADIFDKTNRTEALGDLLAGAKRHCPGHPLLALSEATFLRKKGEFRAARAVLEAQDATAAAQSSATAQYAISRAHLLGEICDRLDDPEAAFAYFSEGNRRCAATQRANEVDGPGSLALIDRLVARFTSEWVAGWSVVDTPSDPPDPVFLVGFPRSGTTLTDTILRSHPAVSVLEEVPIVTGMRQIIADLPGGYPNGLACLEQPQILGFRRAYFRELAKHLHSPDPNALVIDKLPLNLIEAGLIHRVFPRARFLFVLRHPCDCVLSCFMQNFQLSDAMANFLTLETAARYYDRVMTLWQVLQDVLPLKVFTLRYESLLESFEETLTPALDFLGVGWDERLRDYIETARQRRRINTPSYNQVIQPLYTRAKGRWERYRPQMEPALPLLQPWADRFGYQI